MRSLWTAPLALTVLAVLAVAVDKNAGAACTPSQDSCAADQGGDDAALLQKGWGSVAKVTPQVQAKTAPAQRHSAQDDPTKAQAKPAAVSSLEIKQKQTPEVTQLAPSTPEIAQAAPHAVNTPEIMQGKPAEVTSPEITMTPEAMEAAAMGFGWDAAGVAPAAAAEGATSAADKEATAAYEGDNWAAANTAGLDGSVTPEEAATADGGAPTSPEAGYGSPTAPMPSEDTYGAPGGPSSGPNEGAPDVPADHAGQQEHQQAEQSCNFYGCGAFVPSQACQCDTDCTSRGDCCADHLVCVYFPGDPRLRGGPGYQPPPPYETDGSTGYGDASQGHGEGEEVPPELDGHWSYDIDAGLPVTDVAEPTSNETDTEVPPELDGHWSYDIDAGLPVSDVAEPTSNETDTEEAEGEDQEIEPGDWSANITAPGPTPDPSEPEEADEEEDEEVEPGSWAGPGEAPAPDPSEPQEEDEEGEAHTYSPSDPNDPTAYYAQGSAQLQKARKRGPAQRARALGPAQHKRLQLRSVKRALQHQHQKQQAGKAKQHTEKHSHKPEKKQHHKSVEQKAHQKH